MEVSTVADDLCPPGESRTGRELIVKLVVAHVTAVVAFCNLLSLRNERLDSIEPVLFLFSPLCFLLQTVLGLVLIHVVFLCNVVVAPKSFSNELHVYVRRWRVLFCKKCRLERASNLSRTSTGMTEANSPQSPAQSRLGSAWVRLGRSLAVVGTLFQCVATIFLYRRRMGLHGWEALTVADHRCFELAVGGTTASLISLALLLRFPGFCTPAPETNYIEAFEIDPAISFFRGDPRRVQRWWKFVYFSGTQSFSSSTAFTYFFCVLASILNGHSVTMLSVGGVYSALYEDFADSLPSGSSKAKFFQVVAFSIAVIFLGSNLWVRCVPKGAVARLPIWVLLPLCLLAMCGALLFFCLIMFLLLPWMILWMPGMISGSSCILFIKIKETRMLFQQPPFGPATEEHLTCPALWKDPATEYLWSLM
ncbi:hypothetical protein B0T10DRAFT_590479 [Thelonectria olida]|uniref:Uncharacterized protein n=1 Tax=Thelonectria olida TaxID=1576542 RepID=A0A9P8WBG1_9HYPO|nr:hypothetical protein B0T10DRAFT_590479 [Thelonectria olida]